MSDAGFRRTRRIALLACAAAIAIPTPLLADTLQSALQAAYDRNPTLTAQRAAVRAADENVPIARAAGMPSAEGTLTFQENVLKGEPPVGGFTSDPDRQLVGSINLTVPLITFGAVGGAVRAAEARVTASQYGLRGTEAELFTAVVGAYMDVIRDEAVVRLNRRNHEVLSYTLQETRDRQRAGERADSDVAQAEAREALAASQLETAQARLVGSRENYIRFVGQAPGALDAPPPLPALPASPDIAVSAALEDNPNLLTARAQYKAAEQDVVAAKGESLPKVNAIAGLNHYDYLDSLRPGTGPRNNQQGTTGYVGAQLKVPIFQGGREYAQIRQARAREAAAMEQVTEAERKIIAETRSAYATWHAANRVIGTAQRGVAANERALTSIRAQVDIGIRPFIDRLNADQELLNSQVTQVTAQRDAYVAGFALLAAMGHAEAKDLNFTSGPLYDPTVNYRRVHGLTLAEDGKAEPIATGTREVPAQTSEVDTAIGPVLQR